MDQREHLNLTVVSQPKGQNRKFLFKCSRWSMLIGYMRVSSNDERQSVALQRDVLIADGVDPRHLHQDHASGARDNRPGLKFCLAELREGDVLSDHSQTRGSTQPQLLKKRKK